MSQIPAGVRANRHGEVRETDAGQFVAVGIGRGYQAWVLASLFHGIRGDTDAAFRPHVDLADPPQP